MDDCPVQSDVESAIDFTWELLFLSPWELVYIGIPMSVLAFYVLTIYAIFEAIQKKYSWVLTNLGGRMDTDPSDNLEEKPRRRGGPTKAEIDSKSAKRHNSAGGRKKIGRPKGDAGIINEYKARMLASPKSRKVLDSIFNAAMDDEHKNQAAAWKLVMDRILPVAAFEKDIVQNGGKSAIQINITGVGSVSEPTIEPTTINQTTIDGDSGEILQDWRVWLSRNRQ